MSKYRIGPSPYFLGFSRANQNRSLAGARSRVRAPISWITVSLHVLSPLFSFFFLSLSPLFPPSLSLSLYLFYPSPWHCHLHSTDVKTAAKIKSERAQISIQARRVGRIKFYHEPTNHNSILGCAIWPNLMKTLADQNLFNFSVRELAESNFQHTPTNHIRIWACVSWLNLTSNFSQPKIIQFQYTRVGQIKFSA